MDMLKELFATAPYIMWSVVSVLAAAIVIAWQWERVKWWWHNTWYSFPMIGKIARFSRDGTPDTQDEGWLKVEKTLCRDYKKFISVQSEHDFNQKMAYLRKAGDNGQTDTPLWVWALNFVMVPIEAYGFSYALAGWTLIGASENDQKVGAYGIALLVSVILVAFTHMAGVQLYRSIKIRHARQDWYDAGRDDVFRTGEIALADDQSKDDDAPEYTQIANRAGSRPSYVYPMIAAVLVVGIAVGATYVRGQVLEKTLHSEVVGKTASLGIENTGAGGVSLSLNEKTLPDADAAQNNQADQKAIADEQNLERHGGWGTFIVLAIIFFFLQALGVAFGYKYAFAGHNSKDAFRAVGRGRYTTYAEVRAHYQEIADVAQAKLALLQQKLKENVRMGGNKRIEPKGDFYKFMEAEHNRELEGRIEELNRNKTRTSLEKVSRAPFSLPDSPVKEDAGHPQTQPSLLADAPLTVEIALQQLDTIQDKSKKMDYMLSLPLGMQTDVKNAIKSRKEEADARAKLEQELDGLFD